MLKNNIKLAFRNFWRQKSFAIINIIGLSVGLTCCLLILLWVQDERSYDQFHTDADKIYQQLNVIEFGNKTDLRVWRGSPYPYYELMRDDIPEIEQVTVTTRSRSAIIGVGKEQTSETGFFATDNFFEIFNFPFKSGGVISDLNDPNTIAISETVAKKYFSDGWSNAVGQSLKVNDVDHRISGVFADVPGHSTLQFDFILPFGKLLKSKQKLAENFGDYDYQIFFRAKSNTSLEAVKTKVLAMASVRIEGTNYRTPSNLIYQPVSKRYLHSKFENGEVVGGRIEYVRIFFIAAIFLLLLACVNYMNLSTARSSLRAREVGVRKTVGADRKALMGQFFTEAFLMSLIAILLSLQFVHLLLPHFNVISGKEISIDYSHTAYWSLVGAVLIVTTIVAGSYPSLLLSSFSINSVLRGRLGTQLKAVQVRKGLVVFQFLISSFLLIGAITVRSQINFIQNKNLGMDKNNVIYLRTENELYDKYHLAKAQLAQHPSIAQVSGAEQSPLRVGSSTTDPTWEGFTEDRRTSFRRLIADYDFLDLMKIPMATGRYFDSSRGLDSMSVVINEKAARHMGMDDPIGKTVNFWDEDWTIIGVVEDFHLASFHQAIEPLIVVPFDTELSYIFVRPELGKTEEAISALQKVQENVAPGMPFNYNFLDSQFEALYQNEKTTSTLADLFALIALFVSTLGLLGLAAFAAERRTKEIGIRKVLGASVFHIVALLSKDFIQLIVIAFVLATPIAWYFANQWLEGFAYHINMEWWIFGLTISIAILITLIVVGLQGLKAAVQNPVNSLRSD